MRPPSFSREKMLLSRNYRLVAGMDEAGCGALAGPVVAAAVILPVTSRLRAIRDCKLLAPAVRAALSFEIKRRATAWAVGISSVEEINTLGIRQASLLAMTRALHALSPAPEAVLSDAFCPVGIGIPCIPIIHGDRLVKSIAAASVIAKVFRDALMEVLHAELPNYSFLEHKGYGTVAHLLALKRFGPSLIHRAHYAPVRDMKHKAPTSGSRPHL
ncbi:MAG: ribonuclease HII [Patescibacteria group bacterium]